MSAVRPGDSAAGAKRKIDDGSEDQAAPPKQQRSKRNRRCGNLNLPCQYAPNCCANNFKDSEEFKVMTTNISRMQEQIENLNQSVVSLKNETARLSSAQAQPPSSMTHPHSHPHPHHPPPSLPPINSSAMTLPPPQPSIQSAVASSPAISSASLQKMDTAMTVISGASSVRTSGMRGLTSYSDSHQPQHSNPPPPPSHHSGTDHGHSQSGYGGYRSVYDNGSIGAPEPYPNHGPADMYRHARTSSAVEDPLWDLKLDEIIRVCRIYDEECGIISPMLSIQNVISHARSLFSFMENAKDRGMLQLNDDKTLLLKIVVCCGMAVEDHGGSERATALYESMESRLNKKLMADDVTVSDITILALLAGYRYLINDDVLAWRIMGQVARLCIEIRLNTRQGIISIPSEEERKTAILAFWSIFILDRRWSLCAGMPYVLTDSIVESNLPVPDDQKSIIAMIGYSRLASRVFSFTTDINSLFLSELSIDDVYNFDMEIRQWYEMVPEEVQVRNWNKEKHAVATTPSYNLQRLRVWTYLRLNQLRIWLYLHVLRNSVSINRYPNHARNVVELAKDSVRYLTHLNNTTSIYRRAQVYYHNFLASIIATLFLACAHAPSQFNSETRKDFYLALELVRDMHQKSWVSKRLWTAVVSMREMAPRLGVRLHDHVTSLAAITNPQSSGIPPLGQPGTSYPAHDDPVLGSTSRSGPILAPLSRHGTSTMLKSVPLSHGRDSINSAPLLSNEALSNGMQLRSELSRLFEGYINSRYAAMSESSGKASDGYGESSSPGQSGELFKYLRGLY
ncbi:hypothetical protein TD95_003651, partial [Thielaviopsis punctulata]